MAQLEENIVNVVDDVTSFPRAVARRTDRWNEKLIDFAQDLEAALNASGEVAEQNLRQNKIESTGRRAVAWITDNWIWSLVGVVILIILIRRV